LQLTPEQLVEVLEGYEKDVKAIKRDALQIAWFMKGGVDYDSAMAFGKQDKEIVKDIIKETVEAAKKNNSR